MTKEEFYKRFADTPIDKRTSFIKMGESEPLTLQEIYQRVARIDDQIRPYIIEQAKCLEMADKYYNN